MHSKRLGQLVLAALSLATAVQATWLDPDRIPNHERRQISLSISVGEPGVTARTTTSSAPPTSPTGDSTTTTPRPPTSSPGPSSTTSSGARTTSAPPTSSSAPPPVTETRTTVVTTTNSDGQTTEITTATTATTTPGFQDGGSNTSSMSPQTRNIVIGVVVGVGGAIILAALGLLAWRIWGRKKPADDSDDLVSYGPAGSAYGGGHTEKTEGSSPGGTMNSRTPFQSTLESYHAPTHVNPSANF